MIENRPNNALIKIYCRSWNLRQSLTLDESDTVAVPMTFSHILHFGSSLLSQHYAPLHTAAEWPMQLLCQHLPKACYKFPSHSSLLSLELNYFSVLRHK